MEHVQKQVNQAKFGSNDEMAGIALKSGMISDYSLFDVSVDYSPS